MSRKFFVFFIPVFLILIVISFFLIKGGVNKVNTSKNQIVTSFYPIYFFTSRIAGDKFDVINITPDRTEPHDYELSTDDLIKIQKSKLLIVNGVGLEPWLEKLKDNLNENEIKITTTGEGLSKNNDPHFWLDPVLAKSVAEKITKSLIEIDPENTNYFLRNNALLTDDLGKLDKDFKTGLNKCRLNQVVTSHATFGYLASKYNLKQIAISGLSPDEEPSPAKISEIADLIKKRGIKYIFFERLVSPRFAETIALETGAKIIEFNPLEGLSRSEELKNKDYFSIQRQNLKNLKIALECN
ncbi:zinc ABC transporter substrate-binding protein [Candidatus Woesebacteria bacterium]|nr:zinc ABC transporter substrate-binding protein [Candidatus Woesebacteria bacterium]